MEFEQVVRKRRSVRNYAPDAIPAATIEQLVQLARKAPSAGFTQGQSYVVLTEPQVKRDYVRLFVEERDANDQSPGGQNSSDEESLYHAPVLIVACTSEEAYHRRYRETDKIQQDGNEITWPVPYWFVDSGASIMVLLLAAVDAGLDACLVGVPNDTAAIRRVLGLPADVIPVGTVTLGRRAPDTPSPSLKRGRVADTQFLHWERW